MEICGVGGGVADRGWGLIEMGLNVLLDMEDSVLVLVLASLDAVVVVAGRYLPRWSQCMVFVIVAVTRLDMRQCKNGAR